MDYTFEELADMHFCYGWAHGNAREARRIYAQKYPTRNVPDARIFPRIAQRLRDTGTLKGRRSGGRQQQDDDLEERVLRHVEEDPSTSTRHIAAQEGVSNSTVWRILKEQQLHPYHLQRVQELLPGDLESRYNFCNFMLQKIREDPDFISRILFTDEASFDRCGRVNLHNEHIWADENPHACIATNVQRQFTTNIWAGIFGDKIIGPIILPPRLRGETYLHFLQLQLPEMLEDVPLQIRGGMWFMHDGAPPHYAMEVRDYLNNRFGDRWIGRGGPIPWPARSPDLNPLDFYFWGHLKSLVYCMPIRTQPELEERIQFTSLIIGNIMGDFQIIRDNFRIRLELCMQQNGGHFENLL